MEKLEQIDIDTIEDWKKAEEYIKLINLSFYFFISYSYFFIIF